VKISDLLSNLFGGIFILFIASVFFGVWLVVFNALGSIGAVIGVFSGLLVVCVLLRMLGITPD
jgi:hypothetical protein